MNDFPRVLFITPHAFNGLTGGGITYSNLFKGWPKDKLATIHNDIVPTSNDVCDRYFKITQEEIDLVAPLRLLRKIKRMRQGEVTQSEASVEQVSLQPSSGGLVSRILGDSVPQTARISKKLDDWISSFNPDIIYTILGDNAMMGLISKVKRKYNLPHIVHIMDDWPDSAYQTGVFSKLENRRMRKYVHNLISSAEVRMGICDAMCDAYSARYAPGFVPFQNTVDIEKWAHRFRKQSGPKVERKTFLYVGSIFPNAQLDSLIDCANCIIELNNEGHEITFEIASPDFLADRVKHLFPQGEFVRFIDPIDDDEKFYEKISSVDALLVPVNFDDVSVKFIKYSMPTKIPAYMACGTPILVYGPEGLAQVTYAQEYEWGIALTERHLGKLKAHILDVLSNSSLRQKLMTTAQKVASQRHDAAVVRQKFQKAFLANFKK